MPLVARPEFHKLSREFRDLRSPIAKAVARFRNTSARRGRTILRHTAQAGRKAWLSAQYQAAPIVRAVERRPLLSWVVAFGALGLCLGLLFARRS